MQLDVGLIGSIASIVLIDLVLSGDNAVVIGMAARSLPPVQRRRAIILGGAGAIGLRVLFAAMAAFLLSVPLLQAIGGVLLAWIALKLLRGEHEEHRNVREADTLLQAIRIIILADVVMSLDNILAVGGVAHGSVALLLFGLGLSMPIILFGSSLVATLMNRLPWLVYAGSAVLAWTAGGMIMHDKFLRPYLGESLVLDWGLPAGLTILIPLIGMWYRRRAAAVGEESVQPRGGLAVVASPAEPPRQGEA